MHALLVYENDEVIGFLLYENDKLKKAFLKRNVKNADIIKLIDSEENLLKIKDKLNLPEIDPNLCQIS